MPYFNYRIHARDAAEASFWERREFLNAWWAQYRDDSHWTPPRYGRLRRELDPSRNDHLTRLRLSLLHIDALYRTGLLRSRTDSQEIPLTSVLERPLAAAVAVIDPRRKGRTAHLALPHFSSDEEAFDRMYYHLVETLSGEGYHRIVGPVGLSPHLGSGLLVDGWDEWPPLHAPSNPPYVPELVERRWQPMQTGRLYRAAVPSRPNASRPGPATLRPFDPARLAADLLPLLIDAAENPTAAFPPPDAAEAAFLLRRLEPDTPTGFLAEIDGDPVGFVLLCPDTAGRLRATRGGRSWLRRALYGLDALFSPGRRESTGRILFAVVRPSWRGQGIGGQLWDQALRAAGDHRWDALTIGPVWRPKTGASATEAFLEGRADVMRQSYRLYEWSF